MKIYIPIILCLACLASAHPVTESLSFTRQPYVNPRIIEHLVTMISDSDDQVVAIDLYGSQDSNMFFCEGITNPGSSSSYELADPTTGHHIFSYRYIGRTDSNIIVLYTFSCGEGSMSEHNLLFVTIEHDKGLEFKDNVVQAKDRYLLKKLGEYGLGDRYKGDIKVKGNQLFIGKDHGWFSDERDDGDLIPRTNDWTTIYTFPSVQPLPVSASTNKLLSLLRRLKGAQ